MVRRYIYCCTVFIMGEGNGLILFLWASVTLPPNPHMECVVFDISFVVFYLVGNHLTKDDKQRLID
jgi:hypothetical protein